MSPGALSEALHPPNGNRTSPCSTTSTTSAGTLHPPYGDRTVVPALIAPEDPFVPRLPFAPVEDDEVSRPGIATVHAGSGLLQALADGTHQALVQHLALDHDPGLRGARRLPFSSPQPDDEQVGTSSAQTVLPHDAPAAVHHALLMKIAVLGRSSGRMRRLRWPPRPGPFPRSRVPGAQTVPAAPRTGPPGFRGCAPGAIRPRGAGGRAFPPPSARTPRSGAGG